MHVEAALDELNEHSEQNDDIEDALADLLEPDASQQLQQDFEDALDNLSVASSSHQGGQVEAALDALSGVSDEEQLAVACIPEHPPDGHPRASIILKDCVPSAWKSVPNELMLAKYASSLDDEHMDPEQMWLASGLLCASTSMSNDTPSFPQDGGFT